MVSTTWKTNSINVKKLAQLIEAIKTILNLLFLKKKDFASTKTLTSKIKLKKTKISEQKTTKATIFARTNF